MKYKIKQLLRESLLDEKIGAGSFIVYHRTRGTDPSQFNKGFNAGGGDYYGRGFYSTYELEDQLNDKMRGIYGPYIYQFKINNSGKFIILDEDQAKRVYGEKADLNSQLKKVMGGNYRKFIQDNQDRLPYAFGKGGEFTSTQAHALAFCKGFISNVDGMVFTGKNDGKVLLLYNTDLANPLQYSDDEGKTWKNVKDVSSHQIGRDVRTKNKDINNFNFSSMNIEDRMNDYDFIEELIGNVEVKHIVDKVSPDKQLEMLSIIGDHFKTMDSDNVHAKATQYFEKLLKMPDISVEEFKTLYDKIPIKPYLSNVIIYQKFKDRRTIEYIFGNDFFNTLDYNDIWSILYSAKNSLKTYSDIGYDNVAKLHADELDRLMFHQSQNPNSFVYDKLEDIYTKKYGHPKRQYRNENLIKLKKLLRESLDNIENIIKSDYLVKRIPFLKDYKIYKNPKYPADVEFQRVIFHENVMKKIGDDIITFPQFNVSSEFTYREEKRNDETIHYFNLKNSFHPMIPDSIDNLTSKVISLSLKQVTENLSYSNQMVRQNGKPIPTDELDNIINDINGKLFKFEEITDKNNTSLF